MLLSKEAKWVSGITVLVIPTIMYGGWTLLGILTHGSAVPMPGDLKLDDTQWALWRAGHAHAGVWTILSLLLQILLDSTRLTSSLRWLARVAAPVAAVVPLARLCQSPCFNVGDCERSAKQRQLSDNRRCYVIECHISTLESLWTTQRESLYVFDARDGTGWRGPRLRSGEILLPMSLEALGGLNRNG